MASVRAPTVRAGSGRSAYGRPSMVAEPEVGRVSPSSMRMVVDLPAPLAPTKPVIEPGSRLTLRSSTAVTAP